MITINPNYQTKRFEVLSNNIAVAAFRTRAEATSHAELLNGGPLPQATSPRPSRNVSQDPHAGQRHSAYVPSKGRY